jgi:hypothetical protein
METDRDRSPSHTADHYSIAPGIRGTIAMKTLLFLLEWLGGPGDFPASRNSNMKELLSARGSAAVEARLMLRALLEAWPALLLALMFVCWLFIPEGHR